MQVDRTILQQMIELYSEVEGVFYSYDMLADICILLHTFVNSRAVTELMKKN
jgi:hypothetical protein